ncbi:hypothetical protein [Nonomuraea jabiensis]|uniref:hypothetical protein n=1 Tax=Nonomuraea jabiensis TaxID=882448 RepID=UPI003D75D8BE
MLKFYTQRGRFSRGRSEVPVRLGDALGLPVNRGRAGARLAQGKPLDERRQLVREPAQVLVATAGARQAV